MRQFVILFQLGPAAVIVACCCAAPACSTRSVDKDEPVQSPASPQAQAGPWDAHVRALAGDPPLPGDPALDAWPGLAAPAPAKPKATTVYVCPMHADVRSNQPGQCPRCHMQLEAQP